MPLPEWLRSGTGGADPQPQPAAPDAAPADAQPPAVPEADEEGFIEIGDTSESPVPEGIDRAESDPPDPPEPSVPAASAPAPGSEPQPAEVAVADPEVAPDAAMDEATELAADAASVDEVIAATERAVEAVEAAATAAPGPASEQMLDVLGHIEQQLTQLSATQREHAERIASLGGAAAPPAPATPPAEDQPTMAELEDREQELHAQRLRNEELEAQLANAAQQLEGAETVAEQLELARTEVEQLREFGESAQAEIAERTTQIEQQQARITELEQAAADAGARAGAVADHQKTIEQQQARIAELEQAAADAGAQAGAAAAKEKTIEHLQARIQELEQAVADAAAGAAEDELKEQVEHLEQQLAERDQALEELRAQGAAVSGTPQAAASDGASPELIEQQRRQIERLTEQLASLQGGPAEPEEIRIREDRIAELEDELEQLRASKSVGKLVAGVGGAVGDALRRRKGKSKEQPEPVEGGAPNAALEARVKQLETQNAQLDNAARAAQTQVESLREQLEAQETSDAPDDGAQATIDALQAQVRELEAKHESASAPAGDDKQVAQLKQRVQQLEAQLAEATAQKSPGGMAPPDKGESAAMHMRIQHLEAELNAARDTSPHSERHRKQAAQLREQWQELRDTRAELMGRPGGKRRRRWLGQLIWVVLIAGLSGAGSVMAVNKLFPPVVSGSVRIEAKSRKGGDVSEKVAEAWQTWHEKKLGEPTFTAMVSEGLGTQRVKRLATPENLKARMARDLTVESPRAGALTLTLVGKNAAEILTVLDTIALTLARESSEEVGGRAGDAIAVVQGERREGGRDRYAELAPEPISDRRMTFGPVLFGAFFVVGLFVFRRAHKSLQEARGLMEEAQFEASDAAAPF